MTTVLKSRSLLATTAAAVWCCTATYATAQQSTLPKPTPQEEAGEPRANTSAAPTVPPQPQPKPQPQPPPVQPSSGANPLKPSTAQSEAGEPRAGGGSKPVAKSAKQGPGSPADPSGRSKGPGGTDRLDLGTATVTGDREQPKVMYIVPWKRSDIGDLAGKPMNSLVDEILAPVDRDVFKREVVYYKAVQSDATQNGAPAHHSSDRSEK
jgi:hypothetical protein